MYIVIYKYNHYKIKKGAYIFNPYFLNSKSYLNLQGKVRYNCDKWKYAYL